tara:strand:- start:1950 stop:2537 length:588 start_codon:yes stop_codon:yes gene_type:complete
MTDSKNSELRSVNIWKNRPNESGLGSRGDLAIFKIKYINDFIKEKNIESMIDFGCGDLQVSSNFEVQDYLGVDIVAHTHPDSVKSQNYNTTISRFDEFIGEKKVELCTCLDVFYHILNDELEYLHATIKNILEHSTKYVIIYAQDSYDSNYNNWKDHMHNSPWRQIIEKENVKLVKEQKLPQPGTTAKFFIYEKI